VLRAERGEQSGEVDRAHPLGLHRPEHDRSAQAATYLVDRVPGRLRRGQRRARFWEQRVAGVGQPDAVRRAVEQHRPELLLEVADTGRDG
jgi:hypothetical protein